MPVSPTVYPKDLTASLASNHVENEEHIFTSHKDRIFVPNGGPFFSDTLIIRDKSGKMLAPNTDFKLLHLIEQATIESNKSVVAVIYILDKSVQSVTLDYRVIGGEYSNTVEAIKQELQASSLPSPNVDWEVNVYNKPPQYPPAPHRHHGNDFTDWDKVLIRLDSIRRAITHGDSASWKSVYAYIEQRIKTYLDFSGIITKLNKLRQEFDAYLRNVQDYGVATQEDIKNRAKDKYLTPYELFKYLRLHGGLGGKPEEFTLSAERQGDELVVTVRSNYPDSDVKAEYEIIEGSTQKPTFTISHPGSSVSGSSKTTFTLSTASHVNGVARIQVTQQYKTPPNEPVIKQLTCNISNGQGTFEFTPSANSKYQQQEVQFNITLTGVNPLNKSFDLTIPAFTGTRTLSLALEGKTSADSVRRPVNEKLILTTNDPTFNGTATGFVNYVVQHRELGKTVFRRTIDTFRTVQFTNGKAEYRVNISPDDMVVGRKEGEDISLYFGFELDGQSPQVKAELVVDVYTGNNEGWTVTLDGPVSPTTNNFVNGIIEPDSDLEITLIPPDRLQGIFGYKGRFLKSELDQSGNPLRWYDVSQVGVSELKDVQMNGHMFTVRVDASSLTAGQYLTFVIVDEDEEISDVIDDSDFDNLYGAFIWRVPENHVAPETFTITGNTNNNGTVTFKITSSDSTRNSNISYTIEEGVIED